MKTEKREGILLDADYILNEKGEISIRLYVKVGENVETFTDSSFLPYFYVIVDDVKGVKEKLLKKEFDEKIKIVKIEKVEKENAEKVLKLYFKNPMELSNVREQVRGVKGVLERREYDIPFVKRYLIDRALEPMNYVEMLCKGNSIGKITVAESRKEVMNELNIGCFDLETYSKGSFSNAEKDPIISIAYTDGKETAVFSYKKEFGSIKGVKIFENEKEMIKGFVEKVKEGKLDVIVTYNGDLFDFPYLNERAAKFGLKIDFDFGEPTIRRKGMHNAVRLKGMQHIDAYQIVRLLSRIGALRLVKFGLESVAEAILGEKKEKLHADEISAIWDKGKGLERLVKYNREDAEVTLRIAREYLPLIIEMAKLVRNTIYDVSRVYSSELVGSLLIAKSFENNYLIPNKPEEGVVKQRMMQTYKGGYVKEPLPGLHENIAVLDFRSLHPSIMISHNVSPETLKCEHKSCKEGKNLSPDKDWFCEKKKGFIPMMLTEVLEKRMKVKEKMEKIKKGTVEYNSLHARQHALKILLNATYGSLGYARFRWYSRESAKAVTAWSRHYIRDTIHKAERAGFTPLYGDTDSALLIVPNEKSKKDVFAFVKKINSELPGVMELEFEGYYKRGIFVTKKEGGAAKKRYALIDFENNLSIVGFEYVRRDWAVIARETQKEVIEAVLKEGKPEKAIGIVRKRVGELKKGNVPKRELIILTQLQKPLDKYESIGPHIAAARKAVKKGKEIAVGSLISYIITKSGKSISDKAELEEYVKEGNYDADYYIENQVVPAVSKIMAELGYSREDLIQGGKQKTLSSFN